VERVEERRDMQQSEKFYGYVACPCGWRGESRTSRVEGVLREVLKADAKAHVEVIEKRHTGPHVVHGTVSYGLTFA
jgi:hypothetical protein